MFNFLLAIQDGAFVNEIADMVDRAQEAAHEVGKESVVTIAIAVRPVARDAHSLLVKASTSSKLPKSDAPAEQFYTNDSGKMPSRRDERQLNMTFPAPRIIHDDRPAPAVAEDEALA